jgi:hypothetical protein
MSGENRGFLSSIYSTTYTRMTMTPYWKRWTSLRDDLVKDEAVKQRAQEIWERSGKPEGSDKDIWFLAKN